MPTQLTRAIN